MQYMKMAQATIGAVASVRRGQESNAQYIANAQANEYNAAVQRQRANTVREVADYESAQTLNAFGMREEQQRRGAGFQKGVRDAAAAQSGVGTDTGSNADVERQSMILSELDALNVRYAGAVQSHDIKYDAALKAHDLESGANLDTWSATNNRNSARWATDSGTLGAVASGLSMGDNNDGGGGGAPGYRTQRPRMYNMYSSGNYGDE